MDTIRSLTNWFTSSEQALAEAAGEGMHAFINADDAYELGPHWHDFKSHLYLLEGRLRMTDSATGVQLDCGVGSKVIVPARCVHREQTNGMTYVLALSVDPATLTGDINRDPGELVGR